MIVSVSRRTDIPALYSDWFFGRLEAGEAHVRNPFNARQLRRVSLRPPDVDGFVFWTRNPAPMLPRLASLAAYRYYFLITITGYGPDLELRSPPVAQAVDNFKRLAEQLGPERAIWRYDPIILDEHYDAAWHRANFARLAERLTGATAKCILSFVTLYAKTRRNLPGLAEAGLAAKRELAAGLKELAAARGIALTACCASDLSEVLPPAGCIDADLLGVTAARDRHQRPGCTCACSVDLGCYDSCTHGCRYCYANASPALALKRAAEHDPASPLLLGWPKGDEHLVASPPEQASLFQGLD
ncbi:MAG: hypothetical protein BWY87_01096 [Deltaproteobacteria bacterium ADurb.Bin510]|nr:MAG: hypothetical protein BWY87_01096 [Deltaproteobacteria bacterium ADurb.Bin510]